MYDREKKHWTVPQRNAQWTWLDPLAKCSSAYKSIWKEQTNAMHTVQVSFVQCILVQLSSLQCIWRHMKGLKQACYCSSHGAIPFSLKPNVVVLCNRKGLRCNTAQCLEGKNGITQRWDWVGKGGMEAIWNIIIIILMIIEIIPIITVIKTQY